MWKILAADIAVPFPEDTQTREVSKQLDHADRVETPKESSGGFCRVLGLCADF